ncbi:MAG: HYR domain-containing protein [Lewinella sp.]|uniref:HYR domain-containing protein n=1 Tax=Lewinella sp. TaxID=2004506 RepID=UPI003D6A65B6
MSLLIMLGLLSILNAQTPVICNYSMGPAATLSQDFDTDTPPFTTSFIALSGLGDNVTLQTPMTVRICFWGDMGNGNETFDVVIAGQTFPTGGFGSNPTIGSQQCRDFIIPTLAADNEINDGDVDIVYNNFGAGWTSNPGTDAPDDFNARVVSANFDYVVDITLNSPSDRCQDGTDVTFVGQPSAGSVAGDNSNYAIYPSTPGFNVNTGLLDVSNTSPGSYTIVYEYEFNGCVYQANTDIEIFPAPVANLQPTVVNCKRGGETIDLSVMFQGANTNGGTFSLQEGTATLSGSTLTVPPNGGCFLVRYTVSNPNGCSNAPYSDEARLLITVQPEPAFTITPSEANDTPTSACRAGGTADVTVTNTSATSGAASLTVNGTPTGFGVVSLTAPNTVGSIVYNICMTETSAAPPVCSGITPPSPCSSTICKSFTVFNDGVECGANAPFSSICEPSSTATDVCPVTTNPNLALSCSFFELNGPQFIDAGITMTTGVATCVDTEVCFTYRGSLPGSLGDAAAGGPTLGELNSATSVICDIITFEICTPRIPVVGRFCFDPIPLGSFEDACDQTVGQIVATSLSSLVGGDGGGGIVVADTDGDGAFDFIVDEYTFPVVGQEGCVPNNIEEGIGTITIRNVTAFPFAPSGYCGGVTEESLDLLELLPIGAIPLVGVIIEDLLAAASCNVELAFSDEETIEIPVLNRTPPVFANCNEDGYVFSEDGICDTEVNWSIPVVYDGCLGDVLSYIGRTAGTDDTNYDGTPTAAIVPTEPGVYQTSGPIPGSDLDPGTYPVTYTAYSCSGVESTCTFDVIVSPGDPMLDCPANTEIKTDVDQCTAVVTGLAPLQGISCASVINYSVAFADGTSTSTSTPYSLANRGTHNDASGLVFPLGVSTVTYTMQVDINGDGDVMDANETQTCNFTVTIIDGQRPDALCTDIDVRLDNTGNVTVFAADPLTGDHFVDGGSVDNCDTDLTIEIAKPGGTFAPSVSYDCTENGYGLVTLRVTDDAGNSSTCLAQVQVIDFFEGIQFDFDIPELCLEANNPEQLDFANYLTITLPDGTVLSHEDVENNPYLGDALGGFGITAFAPALGSASIDAGSVEEGGVYTPGTGTGFVTVSYVLVLPGVDNVPQNSNVALTGCLEIVHTTFELRQPLEMDSPECECIQQNDRIVNLGEITGGLEPYTIQYGGVKFDVDSDGVADDVDGEYTFDVSNGHNIDDFTEDLGNLLVDYTQPTWSFTIVDARGCELFRSGSCDNDDETGTPMIDCTALGAVTLYTRNEPACEVQDTWVHTLPTDNCDVILYTYTIENPDGSIAGPFDLTALLNPDITMPLPDQFYGEYDFEHHSPTENVSTVTYYAEDAVGNFTQCSFTVTVIDDDPPHFINCPEPAVIVDAPPTWCSAFANYSLPLAEDNCGPVTVTQIDDTGLTSGDVYPVGITINTYEAVDETGNSIRCDVKIVVNDFHTPPTWECPDNVVTDTDPGDCGAVVDNIAPSNIEDNCLPNLTVAYRIDDADGNEIANGLDDASGNFFDLGTSTVSYSLQDMPLLLITEVTHELSNTVDGSPATTPTCFDGIQNGDETDEDCGGSVCTSCNCTDNEVTVEILLDNNPTETAWAITEPNNGTVIASGGPYAIGLAGTTVSENICLPNGCYDFVITDTALDGICCASGNGSYTVSTGTGILAAGGEFGTREVTNFCLDGAPAAASLTGTASSRDALEITNFGSASLDVSCLMIERVYAGGSETFAVPTGAILAPGDVLTIHFGDGHDDLANNVFNVPGALDLPITEPTAYIVSLSRSILDMAVMNNYDISGFGPPAYNLAGRTMADYWSGAIGPVYGGGIVRTTVWDTNTAADFVPGEACIPLTIGTLNPMLPQPVPNGEHTAIQAQPTTRLECSFTVEVADDENPVCGLYGDYINYPGPIATVAYGECVELPITVTDVFNIADLNLLLAGNGGDFGNLTFTLISPEGTAIELLDAICPGSNAFDFTLDGDPELADPFLDNCANLGSGDAFVPVGNIEAFNGKAVQGTWILQIGHNGQVSTVSTDLTAWSLDISAREAYAQGDETLENDLDLCGAEFTWLHSILFDNCAGGSIAFTITFEDGTVEVSETLPIFPENTPFTHFFTVGVTQVNYVLTDANGNTSSCGFEVTVLDTQFPEITCPPDLVIQLAPGECDTNEYPTTPIFEYDNCPEYVLSSFPPGTPVPIGDTIITLIITDASGNVTECTYNLTVLEHIPTGDIACVADQNVSLGPDCTATITADMLLSGNDYRCYDNYIVTLYPDLPDTGVDPIPTSPMIGEEFVGQTIIAEICDPATGLCCWGYVHVDFYDEPEFICPPDAMVTCIESTHPDALGYPVVTSCVPGGATIEFDDEVVDNGTCGEPRLIITRTWTVTDGVGNFSQCVQNIVMASFDLAQVVFPESYDGITNPVLDCGEVLNDPSLTSIDSLGVPTIDGHSLYTAGYCTAAMNYDDEVFTICENSYIIFRQWRVINQCLPTPLASVLEFTQTIRVEDIDGPGLTCPEDQTISVSPFNCEATYQVPPLVSVDACSAVTYMVEVDGDTLTYRPDNLYVLTGLDLGDHTIRYLASDACNKLSNCSYTLTVEDQIAPTASCDEQLVVSLGGGDIANDLYGEARILASDIDEGSNDNCSAVTLAVRRNYWRDGTCDDSANRWSPWNGYIDFYCCDINQEVTIELMATDIFGNENTCWMVITPEDKLNPYCYAPDDVSLTCNDLPLAFPGDIATAYDEDIEATSSMMSSIFGGATGTDNCAVDTIVERTPNIAINECGWGTITRRFEAWQLKPEGDVNDNGAIDINEVYRSTNSCSQVITITEVHNFVIDFPEDAAADCGAPDVPTIITTADGCDVLSINIGEPEIFAATGDECYKLSITYDIINWCLWDGEYTGYVLARMTEDDGEALPVDRAVEGNERPVITYTSAGGLCIDRDHTDRDGDSDLDNCASPQLPNYGRYIYTQFVKVYDSTVPVITVGEYGGPTDLCPTLEAGQFGDVTGNCEAPVSIPFSITDDCELFDGAGNLVISMVSAELDAFAVDINGDGDIKSNEFLAEAGAAGNVMANITDNGDGTYSFDGNFPIITSAMGDNIYHAVRVLFEDGCGNQVSETLVFDVIDCKGPAPVCINGLTVTLMPQAEGGCAMTIWASDFEGSPISDCTGQGPELFGGLPRVTKYAIYRASEVEGNPDFVPHPTNTGLVLTQDDDQTTVVYIYAFDEEGNYDYCETYVLVQEHNSCNGPDDATIAGVITTTANETIEGVEVSINGAAQMNMTTGTDGAFIFQVPQLGGDYTVTPYHNDNPLNGVSTFDIVLISKHILNIDPLDTPYQRLAADVNNSETITTLDMIHIRKLVLNITTSFTNNTSWRFVPADYVFPNALNPWQETFPELININNLSESLVNADFVGVKTGDVNGNAQANALVSDDRTLNGAFYLEVEDIELKAGNTYTVAFTGEKLSSIQGYQGTLQWSGMELLDIEYGAATSENFGLRFVNQGMITTSWNQSNNAAGIEEVLFSLVFHANEDAQLSNLLQVSSRYTAAEAYRDGTITDFGLSFFASAQEQGKFVLYQNVPNPFTEGTIIGFDLPVEATATITIRDAKGALIQVIEGDYSSGYHTVQLTKQMINGATGVFTYTVEAGDYRATKQMIVVD